MRLQREGAARSSASRSGSIYARGLVDALLPSGWGFLVAWGTCLLFSSGLSPDVMSTRICWLTSMLVTSVALLAWSFKKGPVEIGTRAVVLWSLAIALGTIFFALLPSSLAWARVGSIAIAAMGVAGMTMYWGRAYAAFEPEKTERSVILSSVPVALCYLMISMLPTVASAVCTSLLPFMSGVCLVTLGKRSPDYVRRPCVVVTSSNERAPGSFRSSYLRTGLGIFAYSVAIALLWTLQRMSFGTHLALHYNIAVFFGTSVAAIIMALSFAYARQLTPRTFYYVILPCIVFGYVSTTYENAVGSILGYGLAFLSQTLLTFTLQVYLGELASKDLLSLGEVFGFGRFFSEFGLAIGFLCALPLQAWLLEHPQESAHVACLIIAVLVAVAMLALAGRPEWMLSPRACGGCAVGDGAGAALCMDSVSDGVELGFAERCALVADRFALSPREREVLVYLAKGHSLSYIRNELVISKNTVDTHARHIYRKCSVHSKEELIDLVDRVAESGDGVRTASQVQIDLPA